MTAQVTQLVLINKTNNQNCRNKINEQCLLKNKRKHINIENQLSIVEMIIILQKKNLESNKKVKQINKSKLNN